jgi:hypothetical protein
VKKTTRTERVDQVLEQALRGEDVDRLMAGLSEGDKELFHQLVARLRKGGGPVSDDLWLVDYTRRPPTMAEFIEDPYWMGDVLVPSEFSRGLFPTWREKLVKDFDIDSRVHNIVITGSLAIGKCHYHGYEVLGFDGVPVAVQHVRQGDWLMGPDSRPRRVVSVCKGAGPLYLVKPRDFPAFWVNGEHKLVVSDGFDWATMTPEQWLAQPLRRDWQLRRPPAVTFNSRRTALAWHRAHGRGKDEVVRRTVVLERTASPFTVEPAGHTGDYYGFTLERLDRTDGSVEDGAFLGNTLARGAHPSLYLGADGVVHHNTYITGVIFLYRVVLASLLRYPERFFGLGKGSRIYYVLLSITRAAVSDTIFGDVQNFMAQSPYFLEECHFNPERKYADFRVGLGRGLFITAGSKGWHVIGRNTMGVALDEGNWRLEANPDQRAYDLYGEVRQRIKGRFQQVTGYLPAISILASSARDESAFTETVINEINQAANPAVELVYRHASYEIREGELRRGQRWFRVMYGLKNIEPAILQGFYTKEGAQVQGPFEEAPHGSQTKLVPEDFLPEFRRNMKLSLQGICGVSTGGSHLFFGSPVELETAVKTGEAKGVRNPADVEHIPISVEDTQEVWDYLKHERFLTRRSGSIVPLRDPDAPRFAHLDMATESIAGVAICHPVGKVEVSNVFKPEIPFQLFSEYRVVAEYDFILAIVSGKTKPISFEKVLRFFFWLRERCGFRFEMISADQYQSVMPLQVFETRGFKVRNVSVDRTKLPYYAWRAAFTERRVWLYRHGLFMREAEQLIDGPDKVDHRPEGSKDLTDAACGAYYNLLESEYATGAVSAGASPVMTPDMEEEKPPIDMMPPPPKREAPPVYTV